MIWRCCSWSWILCGSAFMTRTECAALTPECAALTHKDEFFAAIFLRIPRHIDKFKLMRMLCTASHDTIHEARLGVNGLTLAVQRKVDRTTCAQDTSLWQRDKNYEAWLIKHELWVRAAVRAVREHRMRFIATPKIVDSHRPTLHPRNELNFITVQAIICCWHPAAWVVMREVGML